MAECLNRIPFGFASKVTSDNNDSSFLISMAQNYLMKKISIKNFFAD
jgi:hypothetical protein